MQTINAADRVLDQLKNVEPQASEDFSALKYRYADECRVYYTIAALSRRARLEDALREGAYSRLFRLRAALENAIVADLERCGNRPDLLKTWASKSFFGVSAKQGVSIRYALASCIPTRTCGARCYAHDGRDREIHHLFRGALNYHFGQVYETSSAAERKSILVDLSSAVAHGVKAAREDQAAARKDLGFSRSPRIRFSHVGEMASTPQFTNDLARQVHSIDPEVACVIYTRHPMARFLDRSLFVMNFTLEGDDDPRRGWAPSGSRIVSSAWDGQVSALADINFLEHHTASTSKADGVGAICPVTADHERNTSCDIASCDLCFVPPKQKTT
jgi:hypothetical protein